MLVFRSPRVARAVGNFNATDYRDGLLATVGSGSAGYVVGGMTRAKVCMRTPTAVMSAGLGLCAGMFYATQSSAARLMGFRPS